MAIEIYCKQQRERERHGALSPLVVENVQRSNFSELWQEKLFDLPRLVVESDSHYLLQ